MIISASVTVVNPKCEYSVSHSPLNPRLSCLMAYWLWDLSVLHPNPPLSLKLSDFLELHILTDDY